MTAIWNALLKLKTLPFGSVHCIHSDNKIKEVEDIVTTVMQSGCMADTNIHNTFTAEYSEWISKSKVNQIKGLDDFNAKVFTNGTTEAFDKFYLKHSSRRLRYFTGEYLYHVASGHSYFAEMATIESDELRPNDVVIFSLPFAGTGNEHVDMETVLSQCDALKIPVLIDCCYFGVCGDITFDFSHPSIEAIAISLSKTFPVQHLRIGMRLTRTDDDDPLFVYNKNTYINRLSAAVGLELIKRYSPDYNYNQYRKTQIEFSEKLGVEPSKCVFFANAYNKFAEYNRGTLNNRLCFSKYLDSGKLPD